MTPCELHQLYECPHPDCRGSNMALTGSAAPGLHPDATPRERRDYWASMADEIWAGTGTLASDCGMADCE